MRVTVTDRQREKREWKPETDRETEREERKNNIRDTLDQPW